MKFPWSTSRSNSGSSDDPEASGVPLENMPRDYTCSICLDPVTEGTTYEYSLWHCLSCHAVNHFRCAKSWFEASNRNTPLTSLFMPRSWKCPSCALDCPEPKARCWCQKHAFGTLGALHNNKPNACRDTCDRSGACVHGEEKPCLKLCHPGPCNIPCNPSCANVPVVPRTPGPWERCRARVQKRKTGLFRSQLYFVVFLLIIYALLGVICYHHIKRWSQPFKYPRWRSGPGFDEFMVLMFGAVGFLPTIAIILIIILMRLVDFFVLAFNLKSPLTKYGGGLLLILIGAGIWMLPILGFAGGPAIAWYNQMKHSCDGLDARVAMYTDGKFEVKSLSTNVPTYDMYLGSHLKPVLEAGVGNNTNVMHPFEAYQRLSISRPVTSSPSTGLEHIAIDVDIAHRLYRILHLNTSDIENQYLASNYKYKSSLTSLPTFHPVSETLISNGTFTQVNATREYMLIPELNIGISNMHGFINDYDQEPFVKIYQNLAPLSLSSPASEYPPTPELAQKKAFKATLNQLWDSKKKVNQYQEVIMRTASFGHGRQRLDVCVKEDGDVRDGKEVSVGVYEDLWVPFAILASYKQRMYEIGEGSGKDRLKGSRY
ncbi:hypothetical protein N431DRAFT_533975 [Stipitochalara longipes BDJ]|nr:hypothetical protein N431DRAFT_533975 [Stipitochalara longipes BDJ]